MSCCRPCSRRCAPSAMPPPAPSRLWRSGWVSRKGRSGSRRWRSLRPWPAQPLHPSPGRQPPLYGAFDVKRFPMQPLHFAYPYTRCSTFLECEAHVVGEDLSRQPADHVESVAGTGLFGAIELGQLPDRGLDPAPDAHQAVGGLLGPGIRHGAPERGLQVDGVGAALRVQDLADEALVPDHQAGEGSEPVPDNPPLIDIGRRQREGDDLIAQIGHEMAMEAEIILLLAGAITPSGLVLAREAPAARHPTVLADAERLK